MMKALVNCGLRANNMVAEGRQTNLSLHCNTTHLIAIIGISSVSGKGNLVANCKVAERQVAECRSARLSNWLEHVLTAGRWPLTG